MLERRGLCAALLAIQAMSACASTSNALAPVDAQALDVTSGAVVAGEAAPLGIRSPTFRATVGRAARDAVEIAFVYRGPTDDTAPLASGELRRQIGLKLRARDTCNVVYVMWHLAPSSGLHVAVKSQPELSTHAACGDRGYRALAPERSTALGPVRVGERHTLRATIDGDLLRVDADGAPAWSGRLPADALALVGPVGLRSDNGSFDVSLSASEARP